MAIDPSKLESDRAEVTDEFVDLMDPVRLEREADRLDLEPLALLDRIMVEMRARLDRG